ncbi:7TM diverse intracellular signaling domain-containing protein [Dethiosulfatarculus sandiegensis]|uniref:7TM-DISM receptor extracellular domain-containing protein n=1 Tax=Dethiosulfatarculus sandiegensis TaxID=1429043 RepID=A0A0D2J5K2_9BACT|nr:7TM diverse intracellular signaling domain-containing protein [Dethiosulfatarculus sandiegensis]KIX10966.1 hypothetical protein X474_26560 [Dethiosulfatarculus sandiegensis]
MMAFGRVILGLLVLLLSLPAYAQDAAPLILNPSESSYDLAGNYAYLVDNSSKIGLKEILGPDMQKRFKPSGGKPLNLGVMPDEVCWLKIKIENRQSLAKEMVLELGTSTINHATLFVLDEKGEFEEKITGDMHPMSQRDYYHRHPNFSFKVKPAGITTIYLKLETQAILETSLTLFDAKSFVAKFPYEYILLGLFYAAFLVAIFYNLFIYFSLKDTNYLLYVLYAASFMSLWVYLDGLGQQFIWPENPWQQVWGARIANTTTCLFVVLFACSFFNCRKNAPILFKIFMAIAALCVFNTIMSCFLPLVDYKAPVRLAWLISIPVIIFTGFRFWFLGFKRARYFLVAWLLVLAGATVFMLDMYLGLIPNSFFTRYAWRMASMLEIILLSLALADRINVLNRQKEEALARALEAEQQLAEGLEEKVAERTRELEKALTEVKQLSGLLPICANCKKIRNEEEYWQQVEDYISQHSEASFTHSICPDCLKKLYPAYAEQVLAKQTEYDPDKKKKKH